MYCGVHTHEMRMKGARISAKKAADKADAVVQALLR